MGRFAMTYFVAVFAVGFALGTLRVLAVEPVVGSRAAELAELPLMALVAWLIAVALVHRAPRLGGAALLGAGVLALALMVTCELAVVAWFRQEPLAAYFAARDPIAFAVYGAALFFFALAPWIAGRGRPFR